MSAPRGFEPAEVVVVRTPLLPFEEIEAWSAGLTSPDAADSELEAAVAEDRERLRERLRELLERPEVAEAIFLASPDLVDSLGHWRRDPEGKKGQRSEQGLVRYLLRMGSRPTPFGLFSGCTPGRIGERTRLELAARPAYRRHSRLDMDFLFALCEHLGRDREVRGRIRFRTNSSLYAVGGRLRYAESRLAGRLRTYHLVAVDAFDALESTLELARRSGGASLDELADALVVGDPDGEVTREDADEFLHELIDHQLLLPELALPVTGRETTPALLAQLAGLGPLPRATEVHERLEDADRALGAIDAGGVGSGADAYRAIAERLEPLDVPVTLSRLFQVDLIKPAAEVSVDQALVDEALAGVEVLHRAAPAFRDGPLEDFRTAFRERYGDGREVPLLEALDEELGVGYERSRQAGAEASPLLSGLPFLPRDERPTVPWSRREGHLLQRLTDTLAAGRAELELTDEDLAALEAPQRTPLPDAFHVKASVAAASSEALAAGEYRLFVEHAGGPSGARLLGRFCHADPAIRAGVERHLEAEEALSPDALFAEIVHLPEGRVGNILARPLLRGWEIPFLGTSGAPPERQIPADDLLVTVAGERIRLRSRRLGREVVPRLTNAHNTRRESLGLYRFLAALQNQGRMGVAWSWGALEGASFLPRVTRGRLVLARARWRVLAAELAPLAAAEGARRYRLAREWRRERGMPRHVALADGDNELLLDFANPLSLDAVVELVKSRDELALTELFPGPDELCAEGPEGRFFHELVVPFVRRAEADEPAVPARRAPPREELPTVTRTFAPGSEWLYAKIYTGTATGDQVLREEIGPLARRAVAGGAAESWFFIRYGDPVWHLRLRFRGAPERLRTALLPELEGLFQRLLDRGLAWKLQLDTYDREIERYGGSGGIEPSEEIFFHDSEAVLDLLDSFAGDAGAEVRWRLIVLGMHRLLDDFRIDPEARLGLVERARDGFATRYQYDLLRKPIADRLREERRALDRLLAGPPPSAGGAEAGGGRGGAVPEALAPGIAVLERRSRALAPLVEELYERERLGRLDAPVAAIVPSYVHMYVNRLSRSAGPEHELVLYDFLVQLYRSRLARAHHARKKKGKGKKEKKEKALVEG